MRENNLARFIKAQILIIRQLLQRLRVDIREVAGCGTFFRRFRGWGVVVLQCTTLLKTMKKLKHI